MNGDFDTRQLFEEAQRRGHRCAWYKNEEGDDALAIEFLIPVQDSFTTHKWIAEVDELSIRITSDPLKLDKEDMDALFSNDGTNESNQACRYLGMFAGYLEERMYHWQQVFTDDSLTEITNSLWTITDMCDPIFMDEANLTQFEYIERCCRFLNDLTDLFIATVCDFGDFESISKTIIKSNKLMI